MDNEPQPTEDQQPAYPRTGPSRISVIVIGVLLVVAVVLAIIFSVVFGGGTVGGL